MADCKSKEEKDTRKMNRTRDVTKGEDTEKNPKIEKGSLRKGKKTDYKKQKGHVLVYSNVSPTLVRMKAPRLPSDPSSSSSDTTPSISPSPLTEQARNRTAVTTHSQTTTSAIESDRRKRVEKASRARFYLLHKTGPTAFTVAGDSPEHKYKVMIGPQTCSCSRGLHCVHLLFVMLRVLQVDQTNPLLWSRTLKNYEVNGLLAQMQDRNRKRIRRGSSCNSSLLASSEQTADDQGGKASYTTSDTSRDEDVKLFKGSDVMGEENERRDDSLSAAGKSGKGEEEDDDDDEDICPICLLEMVDGESLTVHINGCGNSLHHHCMAIWTEEKHRQDESVTCPLCMLEWVHVPSAAAPATSVRDATPFSLLTDDEIKLPLVEPLSQEKTEEMSLWVEVFGLDVTSCLLSRKWNVRETALHRVTQKVVALLLSCASQQEDEASIIKVVEACSQIVAHRCADPVYKVFVAALEVLHAMLATIPCSNQDITVILQDTLYPVIQAIIVKAADPNRRVCNQSLLTLEELCRGQGGELAVGSAMDQCKETEGYGGLPFVLFCALSEEATGNVNWQWWQGRLALLDMLLSQFPFSFQLVVGQEQQSTFDEVYTRLCKVLEFAAKAMSIQHMRVTKLARRVFVRVIRLGAHVSEAVKYMRHLIEGLQDTHKTTLSRRLSLIVGETSNAFHNRSLDSSASFQAGSLSLRSASLEMKKRRVTDEMETKFKTDDNDKETTEETTLQVDAVSLLHGEDKMSKSETDQPDLNWETQSNSPHRDVGHGQTAVSDNVEENSHFSHSYHPVPVRNDHFCKDIEADESEAVFLAMEASQSESGLPVLSGLAPPDDLVTVHVQEGAEGGSQAQRDGSNVYVEGVHWKKGARIGTGAFCTCFLGRDIKTGALMALKQVSFARNSENEQETVIATITEEISMMGRLDHPHLVRCVGATRDSCHFNIFMEWMPGGSVASILARFGSFEEDVNKSYVGQLLQAVAYLHEHRVIHRDVKGANMLIDSTGQHMRLADFGTAARLATQQTIAGEFQGDLRGTIAFMAPEVLRGSTYGRSCDVWSVGCTIIEMATGSPPWEADDTTNHLALIFKIASANGPPSLPDGLSPALRDLTLRCLEVQPADRPTAIDLLKHAVFTRL